MENEFPSLRITKLPVTMNFNATYTNNGFRLIGSPVDRDSRLFGANTGEQKQIENITRICFTYLGPHAI
jgi:hypothetical protein